MSGMFGDSVARITNEKVLELRKNLIKELKENYGLNIKKTKVRDSFGNNNFLLPNFMKEKKDNGDVDIFLFLDNNQKTFNQEYDKIYKFLSESNNVLKSNKNDKIYSFMYNFQNNYYQVDLHLIPDTKHNLKSYFEYYRVDYFFFIFGMILNKLDVKLSTKGIYYKMSKEYGSQLLFLTDDMYEFLYKMFGIKKEDIKNIDSFEKIGKLFSELEISDYDFFTNQEGLRNHYNKKIDGNDKLQIVMNIIYKTKGQNLKDYKLYKEFFIEKLFKEYSFLDKKMNQKMQQMEEEKRKKNEKNKNLCYLFGVDNLSELTINQKKNIPLFTPILKELLLLKEINQELKKYNINYNIYLVGGTVRDLLFGSKVEDLDITGNIPSKKFVEILGGTETEKLGTIFYKKNGIEIEYTPFRKEGNYDGRKPNEVSFEGVTIKEDCKRRDFTINSLYLDINNLNIIDLTGKGIENIKNKKIRTVGNAKDRFNEDYLRLLRAIRLQSKIDGNIENKTKQEIKNYFSKLNFISKERVMEEFLKGLKYKTYLANLNKFTSLKLGFLNKDLEQRYKKFKKTRNKNIFFYLYDLLGYDYLLTLDNTKSKQELMLTLKFVNEIEQQNIKLFENIKDFNNFFEKVYNIFWNIQLEKQNILKLLFNIGDVYFMNGKIIEKTLNNFKKQVKNLEDKIITIYNLKQYKGDKNYLKNTINRNGLKGNYIKDYFKKEIKRVNNIN